MDVKQQENNGICIGVILFLDECENSCSIQLLPEPGLDWLSVYSKANR